MGGKNHGELLGGQTRELALKQPLVGAWCCLQVSPSQHTSLVKAMEVLWLKLSKGRAGFACPLCHFYQPRAKEVSKPCQVSVLNVKDGDNDSDLTTLW